MGLINSLKKYTQLAHSTKAKDIEIKELLLRPLQDVNKVLHKTLNEYRIENYVVLDNKENLHAEYNISLYFPKVGLVDSYYIGVSKLSCGFCHTYLKLQGYEIRGTHGVCAPNKWRMNLSPQSKDFKDQILLGLSEIEDEDAPLQYRRLSIDSFERKELQELYQLKRDLGLNRDCNSAILDFFDSLGSSINYCCNKFVNIISGQYTEISDSSQSEQDLTGVTEA